MHATHDPLRLLRSHLPRQDGGGTKYESPAKHRLHQYIDIGTLGGFGQGDLDFCSAVDRCSPSAINAAIASAAAGGNAECSMLALGIARAALAPAMIASPANLSILPESSAIMVSADRFPISGAW